MLRHLVVLIALGVPSGPVAAQQVALQRASEVRVYSRRAYAAGRLLGLSPTVITVVGKDERVHRLDRSEVLLVQVRERSGWIDLAPPQLPSALPSSEGLVADPKTKAPTARIRVISPRGRIEGGLAEWRADTLFLVRRNGDLSAVPVGPRTRIQVSVGRRSGALPGFVAGFLVGAGGGMAGATALCNFTLWGPPPSRDCGGAALGGALIGGVAVGGLGAAIGSAFHGERWIEVPADSVRAFLAGNGQVTR